MGGNGAGRSPRARRRQNRVQGLRSAPAGAVSIPGEAATDAVAVSARSENFLLKGEARAVTGEAQLDLVFGETVVFVTEFVQIKALGVVARQVAEEAVAVLRRAKAGADGAPHEAEAVHGANGRPGVFLSAESDVSARTTVPRIFWRNPLVVVDHKLGDVSVLPEVLRLCVEKR